MISPTRLPRISTSYLMEASTLFGQAKGSALPVRTPVRFSKWSGPGYTVAGVRFRPGAAYLWLGVPLSEIRNARVPLEEFWKRDARLLADCLFAAPDATGAMAALEQALLRRATQVGHADGRVALLRRSAGSIDTNLNASGLREVCRRTGMSERTLHRHCTDVFGYGFKTLQRILRFQHLLRLVALSAHPNLAGLAMDAGFADQAHMCREVRRLCHATPAELVQLSAQIGRFVQDVY